MQKSYIAYCNPVGYHPVPAQQLFALVKVLLFNNTIRSLQDPTSGLLPLPRVCTSVLPAKWPCFTLDVSKTCQSYPYRMSTDSSERDALSPGVNGKRGTRCTCQVLLTTMKVSLKLIAKHIHVCHVCDKSRFSA